MESLNIAKTQVRRGPSSRAAEPETATAVYGVQSVGGTHFQVCDAFSVNPPGIGESKINEATCDAGGVPRLNARVPLGNQSGRHVRDSNFNPRGKRAPSESESRSSRPQRIQPKRKPKRLRTNSNGGDPPDSPQTGGVASQETLSDTQMSSGGSEQRQDQETWLRCTEHEKQTDSERNKGAPTQQQQTGKTHGGGAEDSPDIDIDHQGAHPEKSEQGLLNSRNGTLANLSP